MLAEHRNLFSQVHGIRRMRKILFMPALALLLAGCGGDGLVGRCEDPSLYVTATSAPPIRVPDGLTVPNESEVVAIPPGDTLPVKGEDDPPDCLEQPPEFFEDDESDEG